MPEPTHPLGPRRFDFRGLGDDDFELLCYLAVLIEFPEAVRLRAPDLGADSALPFGASRGYERCWQAKKFGQRIKWYQCRDSLRAAVDAYRPGRYTFCFADDLTGKQEQAFRRHLIGTFAGIVVDWWGASRLTAALVSSEQGQRIAEHFYGTPEHNTAAFMRAVRAGGPLETSANAMDRLRAAAEWLAANDPFYAYQTSQREQSVEAPGLHPGAIMAVERIGPDIVERIEAIPRNVHAIQDRPPGGVVRFEPTEDGATALEQLNRAFSTGETIVIDRGIQVEFTNLPRNIEDFVGATPPTNVQVTIRPEHLHGLVWPARISVSSSSGDSDLDLDMFPTAPSVGWDAEFRGTSVGVTLSVRLRQTGTAVQANLDWSYTEQPSLGAAEKRDAIGLVLALHGPGKLEITDRSRQRPTLPVPLVERPMPEGLQGWHLLLTDLALIEGRTGRRLEIPDEISQAELAAIREAAHILRTGESRMKLRRFEFRQIPGKHPALTADGGRLRISTAMVIELFGHKLDIGFLVGEIDDWAIIEQTADPATGHVSVVIDPTTEAARNPTFRLESEDSVPTQ